MNSYNHYVRVDKNSNVIYAFSNAFEEPQETDILIKISEGRHFNIDLYYNGIVPCWYVSDNKLIRREKSELIDLYNEYLLKHPIGKNDSEKIVNLESELTNTQLALTNTYEQLIQSQEDTTNLQIALVDVFEQLLLLTGGDI